MSKTLLLSCMLLLFCLAAWAQTKTISGVVTDNKSDPVTGATIIVKGTTKGTSTDVNGKFKLAVPANAGVVLVVNFLGYKQQEVILGTQTQFTIRLEENAATKLDEVIVNIGYTSVSREKLAGAVSSISSKDLKDFPVSTVAEALAGKLAGVSVKASEGAPGADIQVLVRGGTSLTQDNAPLYIVDGVPLANALTILSPGEIQSIDVLKDLASTAIYGARGANGVVVITTKAGRKGRTIVSLDAFVGARQITTELPVLKPYDFVNLQYELSHLHYNGFLITDTVALNAFTRNYGPTQDLEIYKSFPAVDWQDKIFGRNAMSNNQNLSINGGSDIATYNFTMNNTNENGIMINSGLKRTLASLRFDTKIGSKLKFGANVRYSRQIVNGVGTSSTGNLKYTLRYQPYQGLVNFQEYDPNAIFDNTINLSNPLTAALQDTRLGYSNNLITSGQVTFNPIKKLTVRSLVGYTVADNYSKAFSGTSNVLVASANSSSQYASQPFIGLNNGNSITVTNSNTINYTTAIGKSHTLDVLLGQEINQVDGTSFNQTIKYFPSAVTAEQAFANVQQANPPAGAIQPSPVSDVTGERLFSFFGRLMYSYQNRYSLNILARRDGSSKFADAHKWGTFPSAQFAWRLTEEPFMKKLKLDWLNNFKLRASYGTAGNNRVSADRIYQTTFTTSATAAGYATSDAAQTAGLYSAILANPSLKWETTVSKDLGLDLELFGNRLTLSLDGYINKTSDLLLQTNVPQQTGYVTQFQNIGATQNKGLELQLSGVVLNNKNFQWSSTFNISTNRNTIVALQGGVDNYLVSSGWGQNGEDFKVQVGQPVGQFYGYVSDGFYTVDDFDRTRSNLATSTFVLKPGVTNSSVITTNNVQPGMIKLKKLTNTADSVIRTTDRTVLGNVQPKFYGGFGNQFAYKGFDMAVFVNFSYGNKTYNANSIAYGNVYQANGNNILEKYANRFRRFDNAGNLITDWDQLAAFNANATERTPTKGIPILTSDAIEDASFIRISNISLGYSLPAKLLQRTGFITRLRFYITANNLYTFTKYTGYDPEASTRRSNPLTPGVDYNAYPRNRYFVAGINTTF